MGIFDYPVKLALNKVRKTVIDPGLEGIGTIEEINWKDKELFLRIRLNGLENDPVEVHCSGVSISPDGSSITISEFESNMPFAQVALERFIKGRAIPIPEGGARLGIKIASKIFGL